MRFDIYAPCDALKPYIRHFAISESQQESHYKILPDTGVVIGFQYSGRLSYIADDHETPLSTAGITGINDRYRIFHNSPHVSSILVFFAEGGAAVFFRQPVDELFRESISLDNFMLNSELLLLEEQIQEAKSDRDRINLVERFLLSRMATVQPDQLVLAALGMIHCTWGTIRITEVAAALYVSQSTLERRFRNVVGSTPKKFASIVRFKHTLAHYKPETSLTDLGYDAGFYDQAHFIREFKTFTGETPEQFFS